MPRSSAPEPCSLIASWGLMIDGVCEPNFVPGNDLVACLVHLGDALVADKKLIVRSWVREHSLHFISSLKADGAAASVVGSNRFRGLGTPLGNFKLLEGAVPLARHARGSLDQFFVLLQQCRLLIVQQWALGLRIQSGRPASAWRACAACNRAGSQS